jgi:SecD/SecF fusion protein
MLYFSRWKIIAIILTVIAGIIVSAPNFFSRETVASWPDWLPKKQLPLGLDLQGGAHLLLAMDQDEIRRDWLNGLRDSARRSLRDAKIGFSGLGVQGTQLQVKLAKPDDKDAALRELKKLQEQLGGAMLGVAEFDVDVTEGSEPGTILIKPTELGMRARVSGAAAASIETINRRINQLGTSESTVVRQGIDRILIQFPGLKDTKDLKRLIGETAKLTFHEVHPSMSAEDAKLTAAPAGYKIYVGESAEGGDQLLRDIPIVQGEDLADAQPGFDPRTGEPVINFRFNQRGAVKFGAYTTENVGKPFAIVLDNKVLSAPVIREPILGGAGQISGSFTVDSSTTLAVQLRSGALPTKLTIVEERTVGPSLGADSIESGTFAGLLGMGATLLMTTIAYGTFGIYACIGLLAHGVLILALMTAIGTTLTLPGIAGFVLTIAMAVDANVLIYERIREEVRAGRSPLNAIEAGFKRALATILDSNITTFIAAAVLFYIGTGPVRGFAVTLGIGIITTVFTAFTLTGLLVAAWVRWFRPQTVPI